MIYVVKEWNVSRQIMSDGNFVKLVGRQEGLIAYLMTLVGIDPTVTVTADKRNFSLVARTFFGFTQRVIPLAKISETQCGFAFPWIEPILFALISLPFSFGMPYSLFAPDGGGFLDFFFLWSPFCIVCRTCYLVVYLQTVFTGRCLGNRRWNCGSPFPSFVY
ncbi:MAG: hypothetical protein LBT46_02105 [Planctomycetaceae bacterium]|jgi:hypothetical protein|nr:hypothetical protein [Planctomycetaceae bacterium]